MQEAGPKERSSLVNGVQPDSRNLLVERVASGPAFGRSSRLRECFLFLCNRKPTDPASAVREHEIGIEVFGRHPRMQRFAVAEENKALAQTA